MSERFVNIDRDTPMLLPPDLRDWVSKNDLARLVVEAVDLCEMRGARVNLRGSGSAQYPPRMMVALLVYSYSTGIFSSRRIERATYDSVAVRYICSNHHPDHDTIATFRRENEVLFRESFARVLTLAREIGVLKVGTISLDGTRMAGAGSRCAVRSLEQIEEELKVLAGELSQQAAACDSREGAGGEIDGGVLPPEVTDAALRRRKLEEARARLLDRQSESRLRNKPSVPPPRKVSVSEPQSRSLRKGGRTEVVQGYNAQMSPDAGPSSLIVGAHLSTEVNDSGQLLPGLEAVAPEAGKVGTVLVDKGYENTLQIEQVEREKEVRVLCPLRASPNTKEAPVNRRGQAGRIWQRRREMEARFADPQVRELYGRRRTTAEGVFHRIKNLMGFRRFHCWGEKAASAEWMLVCLAHNLRVLNKRRVAGC